MKVYRDLSDLQTIPNAVVTIGSFDGVHAGHQIILHRVCQLAKEIQGESVLVTFHPHPRLIVNPDDDSLRLLNTIEEKIKRVEENGIDHLVIVPFSKEFSRQTPEEYVRNFLVAYFHPKRIVIGYDHKFGNKRAGDIELLKQFEQECGFRVEEISKQEVDNIAVSSTKVRNALLEGRIIDATELLGSYYSLTGNVERGQAIGREIGFPTANVNVPDKHKLIPKMGIYAVYFHHENIRYEGMLYMGHRPTLENHNNYVCEVNIFDFDKEIYGERVRIEFVQRIRDDEKFEGLDALKNQLIQDKASTLAVLGQVTQIEEVMEQEKPLPKVAVVILNYNGRDYLRDFLPSVLMSSYVNSDIIVADNGSDDGSVVLLENEFPEVQIIRIEENQGFAEGYNQALKNVHADYFVLLNSDVETTEEWIEPIIELMERDKTVGACQPKILSYREKEKFEYAGASGGYMDKWAYPFSRGRIFDSLEKDKGQYDTSEEVFWSTGAAMFVRAELFNKLGGFDGDFFAHMEEIDFCWRLKRAGYKVMVKPKSVVYHLGGGTLDYENPRKVFLNFRNSLITILKNEKQNRYLSLIYWRLILDGVAGFRFLLQGKFQHIRAIVEAHWDFFGTYAHHKKKRKSTQEAIDKISIGTMDDKGRYDKSIIWQYFIKGKKKFSELE